MRIRPYIVVDPASGHAAQNPERVVMRVKQHLVHLKKMDPQNKSPAMRKLDVRNLQLHRFVGDKRPVFALVETKNLIGPV